MLKKNRISIILIIFIFIISIFIFFKIFTGKSELLFSYPQGQITFAGEIVPMSDEYYFNKQRFDKEFLITGNTLYQFYLYIKRYPLFIPDIEQKLKEEDIPIDFKYLPIAESALREDVVSSAGAAGIWQFMPVTAERFNLEINEYVDERYNLEKSTDAAIEYLKILYDKFGNRTLAAASYNRGENGIARALESQNVDSYYDLYLNEETSRYIFRIVAIKYLIESYFDGKGVIDSIIGGAYTKPVTENVSVTKIDNLFEWAQKYEQSYKNIKILNPWILGDSLPEGEWNIKILKK